MFSLVGVDGNAFCIMGYTEKCMKKAGFAKCDIDAMLREARSADYNYLIAVCNDYVQKCNEKMGYTEDDDDEDDYEEY
jgi:hypothetical protein